MKIYCMDRYAQGQTKRMTYIAKVEKSATIMRIKIKATVYSAQEGLLEPRFTLHMDRTIIIYFDQFNFIETFQNKNKRK